MNGKDLQRVKSMDDAEWRGYLAAKVEDIQKEQVQIAKELGVNKKCMNNLAIQVAKIPAHCLQVDMIKEHNNRLDELEKKEAASKAVKNILLGAGGGGGLIGVVVLLLKFVFNAF